MNKQTTIDSDSELSWQRIGNGTHVAECENPDGGVLRWLVVNTGSRRWEIVSIRSDWSRFRHGSSYTLREAKEIVERWHADNVACSL